MWIGVPTSQAVTTVSFARITYLPDAESHPLRGEVFEAFGGIEVVPHRVEIDIDG